jgi:phage shock protein C
MDGVKRLYRSKDEKMIAGVCGGLAKFMGLDPTVVRLIFVLLFFAPPSGVLIYLVLWLITPLEP